MTDELTESDRGVLGHLQGIFVRNIHLKGIALLLTFALYLWVGEDRETQIIASAPLQFSVPEDQVLIEPKPDRIKVTLRGRWSSFNQIEETELPPVTVDLTAPDDGRTVQIPREAVDPPPGLRVVSLEPNAVRVEMAEKFEKEVDIEPRIAGRTRGSYAIGDIQVDPSTVEISGPKNAMQDLSSVPTEPIDVTGRVRSFKKRIQLRPESSRISYNLDGPVTVTVPIRAEKIERTLRDLQVDAVDTTYPTEISPPTVDVTVRGPRSIVEDIDPETLNAIVDMSPQQDRPPVKFEKKVEIRNLPADAEVVDIHPTHFIVETLERPDDQPTRQPPADAETPSN